LEAQGIADSDGLAGRGASYNAYRAGADVAALPALTCSIRNEARVIQETAVLSNL